jgi:hypothetical protein
MPVEQLGFDLYTNPRGRISCQGKVGYRGPVAPTSGGWPKIKLDLTAEGNFVLHAVRSDSGDHRSYRVDRMHCLYLKSSAA